MKISLPHTIAALFGKRDKAALTPDEQQTLASIQRMVDNRVKWDGYPNVEELPQHFRLFCIKKSFNPVTQLPEEMRLFLLVHMQSEVAVVVSFDAVKANQHSWYHHQKKIQEAIARLQHCDLSLRHEALSLAVASEVSTLATTIHTVATSSTVAIEAASAWLVKIPAEQTVFPKKQIVEAFQRLIDLLDRAENVDTVAKRVAAIIVKVLDNKLQSIALSPQQDSCQIAILSPNHEFYRVLVLPTKQIDKFMKYVMVLIEPQLSSNEIKQQYYQFLTHSLAMSPRAILNKLLEMKRENYFVDAEMVNGVLEDAVMAYHQNKLTFTEVFSLIQLLKEKECLLFIGNSLIVPLLKLLQQGAGVASQAVASQATGTLAAETTSGLLASMTSSSSASDASVAVSASSVLSPSSTTSTLLTSLAADTAAIKTLYQYFCMLLCPKFLKEAFQVYCHPANPFRDIQLVRLMLNQCKDTPLLAKLEPLLPWCEQLLASPQDGEQKQGQAVLAELAKEYEPLAAAEQIILQRCFEPYPQARALMSFAQVAATTTSAAISTSTAEAVSVAAPAPVAVVAKAKNKTKALTSTSALPALTLEEYNRYFKQWKNQIKKQWALFPELVTAKDPGEFSPFIDRFYRFLMGYNLSALQQNTVLKQRVQDTLLEELLIESTSATAQVTVFATVALAGHGEFFRWILKAFPANVIKAKGYYAMLCLTGFGTQRAHIDCLAQGLELGFEINPDAKALDSLLAGVLAYSFNRHTDTARLHTLKIMLNMLLAAGADLNIPCGTRGFHALQIAIAGGAHQQLIELLLKRGASVTHLVSFDTGNGILKLSALDLALGLAFIHPDLNYANSVINIIKRAGGSLRSGGYTFVVATMLPQADVTSVLAHAGLVQRTIPQGTVMAKAVALQVENNTCDFTTLNQLLRQHTDYFVDTDILIAALRCGREDLANFILRNLPCPALRRVTAHRENRIVTALHVALTCHMNTAVQLLLEDGANPNDLNFTIDTRFVLTALHAAIYAGNADGVALLLRYGASLNHNVYLNHDNFYPSTAQSQVVFAPDLPYDHIPILQFAESINNLELAERLREYQETGVFEVDDGCRLRLAAISKDLELLKKFAAKADVNSVGLQRGKRNTALHFACLGSWLKGIQYLISECHADSTKVNADGIIPRELLPAMNQQNQNAAALVATVHKKIGLNR